jgi:hypothetical protein
VLSGLVRKIHREATVVNLGSPDDLAAVEDALAHARLKGSRSDSELGSRSGVVAGSPSPRTTS